MSEKRHRLEYTLFKICRGLVRILPMGMAAQLMSGLALGVHEVFGWRKEETRARIAEVFPGRSAAEQNRIRREAVRTLGRNFTELISMDHLDEAWMADHVDFGNAFGAVEDARKKGRGVLLVITHFGNWDLAGTVGCARGLPMCFIARQQKNPYVYAELQKVRERSGGMVVDRDDPRLIRHLLEFLANNGTVAILIDIRARGEGERYEFLGRPCRLANGLGLLAAKSGAEVIPFSFRREGRAHHVWQAFPARRLAPRSSKAEKHALLQSCLDDLGGEILEHPEGYFWFNKRWVLEL
ncbi:MAG: lysophospholipid acyltransferase family protein [Verrucomicrobia bacterium]|nr:lysophospholipid acyltransferase family protein [Verrucomicrobiota bacterium]MCH8513685.1 lysophospholipid acyltransferase family protein [Kiritimatiellia bacterium]